MKFKDKVRDIVHRNWHNPDKMLMELNPLIIGWANYFRSGVSSQTFGNLDHFMWHKIWRWALRRHPNKGKDWVKKRYYRKINNQEWTFVTKTGARLRRLGEVKIKRHTKVVDLSSPDDPELTAYWIKRRGKLNFYIGVKAAVFDKQKGICEGCDDWLDDGEAVHLHHRDDNRENWKLSNLSLLHETCHHQITIKMRRTA